jgi:hypothetical protein
MCSLPPKRGVAARAVTRIVDWLCNGSVEEVLVGMVDSATLDEAHTEGPTIAAIFHEDGQDRTARRVRADVAEQLPRRLDDEHKPHTPVSIDEARLELYVGRYGNRRITMMIARDRDHLIAQVVDLPKFGIYPYFDGGFFATTSLQQIGFVQDAQGKIIDIKGFRHIYRCEPRDASTAGHGCHLWGEFHLFRVY